MTDIRKKALTGVIFVTLSNNLIFLLSFLASNIILARLLPVAVFGQFALASFFVSLVGRIKELGFDYAIIHSKEDLKRVCNVYLSLQLILSLIIAFASVPIAVVVSRFYGSEVGMATLLIGLTSLFQNLFNSINAIYDKELMFKESMLINVVSTSLSLAGMVVMGFLGYGLWSLVLGGVPGVIIGLGLLFKYLPLKFHLELDKKVIAWFVNFGPWWHWLLAASASLVVFQFDNFLVGTLSGTFVLGAYTRAYSWATMPTSRITAIISKVAFPVYARLQESRAQLSKAYSLTLSTILLLTVPLSLLSILIIREMVLLLIGEKWLPMVPMFQLLVLYMLLRPVFDDSGAMLVAIGKPRIFNTTQLIQSAVMFVLTTILVYYFGGAGASLGVGMVMLVGVGYQYRKLLNFIDIDFAKVTIPPCVAGGFAFILSLLLKQNLLKDQTSLIKIVVLSLFFMALYSTAVFALKGKDIKNQLREFKEIIR